MLKYNKLVVAFPLKAKQFPLLPIASNRSVGILSVCSQPLGSSLAGEHRDNPDKQKSNCSIMSFAVVALASTTALSQTQTFGTSWGMYGHIWGLMSYFYIDFTSNVEYIDSGLHLFGLHLPSSLYTKLIMTWCQATLDQGHQIILLASSWVTLVKGRSLGEPLFTSPGFLAQKSWLLLTYGNRNVILAN